MKGKETSLREVAGQGVQLKQKHDFYVNFSLRGKVAYQV